MKIFFQYKGDIISLPINPEEFKIDRPGNNENVEVLGLGEVNIIKTPRLIPITIDSFFPEYDDVQKYIDFFETIQKDERPVRLIFKEFNLNMMVSIDGFNYSAKAGEEQDRYYTLELQEWRDYSPILVGANNQKTINNKNKQVNTSNLKSEQKESQKNDIVKFNGGNHYHTSQDIKPTGRPRTAGNAKITLINKGSRHPYHLIGVTGGSDVYGWVDEGSFTR